MSGGAAEPARFILTAAEADLVARKVSDTVAAHRTRTPDESERFFRAAALDAQELPRRLREFLLTLRTAEPAAACVVSGFRVDDREIGPTPVDWARQPDRRSTLAAETWLVTCGSLLGDVFGWATQQDGTIVHDIMPVRGYERTQLGTGSEDLLWWHTEEAFHPYRCDYLGLLCLRNPDRVPTTFASVAGIPLESWVRDLLFEPRFAIRPDDSHLDTTRPAVPRTGKEGRLLAAARQRVERMNEAPERVAVLHGDPDDPYLSIDPFYMDVCGQDRPAREALAAISRALDERLTEVVLEPGDILLLDNYRAVHGRKPFRARYDGTDRWLKRVNITRDLRKSRAQRTASAARVVY